MRARLNGWLRRLPEWGVWLLGLLPMVWIIWLTVTDGLGPDPVRALEHRTGRIGLYFLIGGLAVTPAMRFLRINAVPHRRALGLLAFTYAVVHLSVWVLLDMALLWGQMVTDIAKRPYLLFGATAFVILLALAVTSNKASIRRMGKNWRKLHRFVYVAVPLVVIHWLWALKVWESTPLLWGFAVLVLLGVRLIPRRRVNRGR